MSIHVAPRPAAPTTAPLKAGPIGSGAGVLLTEYPLSSRLGQDPLRKMRTAFQMGMGVPWIRTAERLIGAKVSTVPFTLDDPDGDPITLTYPDQDAVSAWALMDRPQAMLGVGQPMSRSSLLRLWSRHLGLAGNAFLLLDQPEAYAGTPRALAYIRPDRMTPDEDANGNLTGWHIDREGGRPGVAVSLEQVVHFMLEPPDSGHYGPGLVETALLMAQLSTSLDRHLASVLSAGGRLSGFLSPKTGTIPPETMLAMERDWRTITEQPDAAKRLQLIAAPVEFTHTTMTPEQIALVELMKLMRDELFIAWNVPGSLVGVSAAAGLNSGDSRKYDEAALWQGPVHDRLVTLREGLSEGVLSRWQKLLGWTPELELEEPGFDDDSPRYDLLGKSINIAMRNRERRELVGLDPFGDPALDDAVWMPATMVPAFSAPEGGEQPSAAPTGDQQQTPAQGAPSDAALSAAGETVQGKAALVRTGPLRASLLAVRESVARHHTPRVAEAVRAVLDAQRADIARRIREHAAQIERKPRDTAVWFDARRWDRELSGALSGALAGMAVAVSAQAAQALPPVQPGKAGAATAVERVLSRGAARVTRINQATRDEVAAILASALEDPTVTLADVAGALESGTGLDALIGRSGGVVADTAYRAEMIARTELMDAYNAAALGSYADAGITMVEAVDGDGDPECAERDGQLFTVDEADAIEDHPNGTLDWVPALGDVPAEGKGSLVAQLADEVRRQDESSRATLHQTLRSVAKAMAATAERPPEPVVVQPTQVVVDTSMFAEALDRLSDAIRRQPAPVVNVPAPVVQVAAAPPMRKVVVRDAEGRITETRDEVIR